MKTSVVVFRLLPGQLFVMIDTEYTARSPGQDYHKNLHLRY